MHDTSFAEERWVRIMCDYSADGVWHRDGAAGCADDLPLRPELIERIRQWQALYETNDYDARQPKFNWAAFSEEGLAIAKAVKVSLPDWTVVYFDEQALARVGSSAPRHLFEYEISLHTSS
jgi:hypothetical protein